MHRQKKALIVTGGEVSYKQLYDIASKEKYAMIVAVDNGLKILDEENIIPTHIVGDFDTADEGLVSKYKERKEVETICLSVNKDLTDTQAAFELVISHGCEEVYILGALGGARPDHGLANIQLLIRFLKAGIKAYLINETSTMFLIDHSITIDKNEFNKTYISLLPFTEEVKGVTLKGMKYPLEHAVIRLGDSIGVSNEILSDIAEIQLEEGVLIIVVSEDALY